MCLLVSFNSLLYIVRDISEIFSTTRYQHVALAREPEIKVKILIRFQFQFIFRTNDFRVEIKTAFSKILKQ